MKRMLCWLTIASLFAGYAGFTGAAEEAQPPLRAFDGIYGFGWIGDEEQKGLDLGDADFLIAFRCNTDELKRAHLPPTGIVCKKPFGAQPGYFIGMTPSYKLLIRINDHTREQAGTAEFEYQRHSILEPGKWVDVAIAYSRSEQTLTIFRDGETAKVLSGWSGMVCPSAVGPLEFGGSSSTGGKLGGKGTIGASAMSWIGTL